MKTSQLFLITFLLFPVFIFAQSNYRQGYVVKNNGDTLRGFINYHEWNESPKAIEFKANLSDKLVIFDVPSLRSFSVTGFDAYISYVGKVSTGRINSNVDLSHVLDTTVRQDSAFLKVISSGPNVKLLYHADKIKYRYFISEKGGYPYELNFYQYLNENDRIISSATFIDQLDFLLKKYTKTNLLSLGKISEEEYKEDVFIKYTNTINGNKTIQQSHTSGSRFFIGAAAGYTISLFDGPGGFGYQRSASSAVPVIDFGVDFLNNPNIQKSFFRAQISLTTLSPTFHGDVSYFSSTQFVGKLSGQFVYNLYNTDKLKYFIGGGAAFTVTTTSNSKLVATEGGVILTPVLLQPLGNSFTSLKVGQNIKDPYEVGQGGLDIQIRTGVIINKSTEFYFEGTPYSLSVLSSPENQLGNYSYSYKNLSFAFGFNYLFGSK